MTSEANRLKELILANIHNCISIMFKATFLILATYPNKAHILMFIEALVLQPAYG